MLLHILQTMTQVLCWVTGRFEVQLKLRIAKSQEKQLERQQSIVLTWTVWKVEFAGNTLVRTAAYMTYHSYYLWNWFRACLLSVCDWRRMLSFRQRLSFSPFYFGLVETTSTQSKLKLFCAAAQLMCNSRWWFATEPLFVSNALIGQVASDRWMNSRLFKPFAMKPNNHWQRMTNERRWSAMVCIEDLHVINMIILAGFK